MPYTIRLSPRGGGALPLDELAPRLTELQARAKQRRGDGAAVLAGWTWVDEPSPAAACDVELSFRALEGPFAETLAELLATARVLNLRADDAQLERELDVTLQPEVVAKWRTLSGVFGEVSGPGAEAPAAGGSRWAGVIVVAVVVALAAAAVLGTMSLVAPKPGGGEPAPPKLEEFKGRR